MRDLPPEDLAPRFDRPVPPGGYAWWYLDAISEDERHALTVIAFVGSVFSPYYYWSGRHDPESHSSLNVGIYGPGARWAMTERPRKVIARDAASFTIGPSAMRWEGDRLVVDIHETAFPTLRPVRGRVTLHPDVIAAREVTLDPAGRHRWRVVAPSARVEVELERPALRWSGHGYLDHNAGDEPLEAGFKRWDWSRVAASGGDPFVLYDATFRGGGERALALSFAKDGAVSEREVPPPAPLGRSLWTVRRGTRADAGSTPLIERDFVDSPFYTRSLLRTSVDGQPATGVHESLDLDRFSSPIVKAMLPFRMPRVWW